VLQINNLSKSFGPQVLFEDVTLQLNTGCRYGLVGANGAGKTTFLKLLTGEESSSGGEVGYPKTTRLGVLKQDRFINDAQRVLDVAMMGDERVHSALVEHDRIAHSDSPDAVRLTALDELIAAHDGYTLEARTAAILVGLGVPQRALKEPLSTLSGGFKLRVLLAQVLVGAPDVLLLDEPTNHLDIVSIAWLEGFLARFTGCAVIISHDHLFLDKVATHVLDVDYRTVTAYTGNYGGFLAQKALLREQKEIEIARAEKQVAEKRAFVERFKAKATKARQAQSRVKQIEKIEVEELPQTSRRAPRFHFEQVRPSGKVVLEATGLRKAFGENRVLGGVDLTIRRGERVAVIGANGLGKSTLLKLLVERLNPDQGEFEWGHEVKVGYFAQDHKELLTDPSLTPLQFVWDACPAEGTSFVRGRLGRMLFSGEDVDKSVAALSGGEGARLIFCQMMIHKPNVLVLDEPTNHLDLEAIEALTDALLAFEGTLLFVSHDRWFVSSLATRVIEVTAEGVNDFPGPFSEYLERSGRDHLDAEDVALRARREAQTDDDGAQKVKWEERKRIQNRLKSLPKKRDQLLEEISVHEARVAALQAGYATPGFFERTTGEQLAKLQQEEQNLNIQVAELTEQWETAEEEIAELEAVLAGAASSLV
jgi:ATPase subunit of ABC transporter with duplicated ATPase domains